MAHLPEKTIVVVFLFLLPFLVFAKIHQIGRVLGVANVYQRDYSSEIIFWQNWQSAHPDFRDGYLQLAWLFLKTGNPDEARLYLQRALGIDPNFQLPAQLVDLR